jgi:excisionase family DNA binding protein
MSDLLELRQAAASLRLGESTLRKLVRLKQIPHVRLGTRVLFRPSDLERYVAARAVPEVGPAKEPKRRAATKPRPTAGAEEAP